MTLLSPLQAQTEQYTSVDFLQDEYWWGGVVALGVKMPYLKPVKEFNLAL